MTEFPYLWHKCSATTFFWLFPQIYQIFTIKWLYISPNTLDDCNKYFRTAYMHRITEKINNLWNFRLVAIYRSTKLRFSASWCLIMKDSWMFPNPALCNHLGHRNRYMCYLAASTKWRFSESWCLIMMHSWMLHCHIYPNPA